MLNKEKLNANNVETAAHSDPQTNKTTKFGCRGGRLCPPANKQNGITLIALIITIIVMLILVGVTINVALNGNLFGKAETATRETEEKAILEEMLAMMEITDEGKFAYDTIIANMRTKHPEYTIAYSYPNATITGKLGTYNYIVSETEIRIGTGVVPPENEDFEKYIMGADKTGRPLIGETGIIDQSTFAFIDDPLTENVNETETLGVEVLATGHNEDITKEFIYAKYDNKAYKIICDETFKSEKLEMIYEPKGTEGQTTAEGWTILYDNGTTAEAVAPFTSDETLTLGSTLGNVDEAITSYNKAITLINDYVKAETTTYDTGKKITEYTQDGTTNGVRSVGSASETSDASDNKYRSDNLAKWNSAYNGVGKKGDILFEQDLVRMAYWGESSIGTSYWMASRVVDDNSVGVDFGVGWVYEDGNLDYDGLWGVNPSGNANGYSPYYAVRPIITIQNP